MYDGLTGLSYIFLYLKAKTKYGIDKRFNVFDII